MEDQFDWNGLFDDTFFDPSPILPTSPPNHTNNYSPLSVDDIEQILLEDNEEIPNGDAFISDGFFNDILLDSPLDGERSGEVVDVSDGGNSVDEHTDEIVDDRNNKIVGDHKEQKESSDDDPNDPLAKKRKRQLRNKDAALRSRERKKSYVKDLEMKSRYYEAECRRLGSLLQYFMAENQALRFSLHGGKAYNASTTKQESAVLFLESLLLGSLLWLVGIVCQLVLPTQLHHQSQGAGQVGGGRQLPSLVLRNWGSKMCRQPLLVGKRFKASRSKMRLRLYPLHLIGNIVAVF